MHEARAAALRVTAAELLAASAADLAEATALEGGEDPGLALEVGESPGLAAGDGAVGEHGDLAMVAAGGLAAQRANHRSVHGRSLQMD